MGTTLAWLLLVFGTLLVLAALRIHIGTVRDLSLDTRRPFLRYVFVQGFLVFLMADRASRPYATEKVPVFTAFGAIASSRAKAAVVILGLYAALIFGKGLFRSWEAEVSRAEGRPVMTSHGQVIRR